MQFRHVAVQTVKDALQFDTLMIMILCKMGANDYYWINSGFDEGKKRQIAMVLRACVESGYGRSEREEKSIARESMAVV